MVLEKIDLKQSVDKKEYKCEMKELGIKLNEMQQKIREHSIPVIVAFEGWSASGKGTLISKITYPIDPRYFNVYTMNVTKEKIFRPKLWSYWTKIPSAGRMTIFDKSWHRICLPENADKWNISESEKNGYYYDVNSFENKLSDSGVLLIKLFLHISKEEQISRFEELESEPATKWRINENDKRQNRDYDKNLRLFEDMIHQTNTGTNPWNIIEANDINYATIKIFKIIINRIEDEIKKRLAKEEPVKEKQEYVPNEISILSSIDLNKTIDPKEYKEKLEKYQKKMYNLGYKLYTKRRSVVIVYEGWDAAGKGGNIKRLTEKLDPRSYEVIPVAAPTKEELSHNYLWRFWNKMPKDGHFGIFDRSWYGRVMVERVEGFCTEEEWRRSYREINDMELHMANHGTIIFKFWLHIDKDEQLKRFQERQTNPLKQYKITDEDWRNREKWDEYEKAVDEMLFRTDTKYAPWNIVESNDKKFARLKVLDIVSKELEKKLK